jgi:hypothetical protein
MTFNDVHELVLLCVRVPKRGGCTWSQMRQVHAKIREPERFTQLSLAPSCHPRRERLWID